MYVAILGRQPALSLAELEAVFGNVHEFSDVAALVATDDLDIERLGGVLKAGRVVLELPGGDWRRVGDTVVKHYSDAWATGDHKITVGISAYGFNASAREVQRVGLDLKKALTRRGGSLRLVPNEQAELSTATAHHNKLGLSPHKVELLIVRGSSGKIVVAESTGSQNITALARRDQGRPKRDAFVGMLPPKLAQIMINLATSGEYNKRLTILDPFCGTGVIPQEAALLGYDVYGTDLSDKMIDYTRENLDWLAHTHHLDFHPRLNQADAMTASWQQPIDAVVCEGYLGQPFSAPPSPGKLTEVRGNCNHIMGEFLRNVAKQLKPGTPLCVAVPAWRDQTGQFVHLPLTRDLSALGFRHRSFQSIRNDDLLYYREDQVVARELLVIERI